MLYRHSGKHLNKGCLQDKIFINMVKITMFLLMVDIFSRFDGQAYNFFPLANHTANFTIFLLSPILPSLWMFYVYLQVYKEENSKKILFPLVAVNVINAVIISVSEHYGWVYYIDSENIYHRGPLFLIPASITFFLIVLAFLFIIFNYKKIEKKHVLPLMLFALPPFLSVILQIFFYGIPLMLNSVVLSLLLLFFNVQNNSLNTDYLTGINNRKKLDEHLDLKVRACNGYKSFSAIMIDIDNFKEINDTYGHDMGDKALQVSAKLLSSCLRSSDFIARFGGDEFFIVLGTSAPTDLDDIISRINQCVLNYNNSGEQPYKLEFSMGFSSYDWKRGMKVQEFQKEIDLLMYKNKQMKKGCFLKSSAS